MGIKVVTAERFPASGHLADRAGPCVTASPSRTRCADRRPGLSSVLPETTLFDQGYRGKIYQTHGAALPDFLGLGGK